MFLEILLGTDDVRARIVGGAISPQVSRHRCLTPLSSVESRRKWQMLSFQPDVVHATLRKVGVYLEGSNSRVLGFSTGIHTLLKYVEKKCSNSHQD